MTGVSGPLWASNRRDALRFLGGLGAGELVATLLLAGILWSVGQSLEAALPEQTRLHILIAILFTLAALDLANRTPHFWRQVPQRYVRSLAPGWRGIAWGLDLGLHVTTQKVSSLIWAAVAGVVLVAADAAVPVLVSAAVAFVLMVVVFTRWRSLPDGFHSRLFFRILSASRRLSGSVILLVGMSLLWGFHK